MPKRPSLGLSSRDPSNKTIAVRLPPDLANAVAVACTEANITPSEFVRDLVSSWFYGKTLLAGPDAGYVQGRAMAAQLAHAALRRALEALPESHEAAVTMLQGYYAEQAERRRG